SARRTRRVVLAEYFTGSGCGPCASADLAFDAALQRYPRTDFVAVMYHVHLPRPDPMTNPYTLARNKSFGISGVPTFVIDGRSVSGGGPRDIEPDAYAGLVPDIERGLQIAPEEEIRAQARLAGNAVRVKATVERVSSDSSDLRVLVALVEKDVRFSG